VDVNARIAEYLGTQPERKRAELQVLHEMMVRVLPGGRLWFLDGKDAAGRTVSNPNIGYGCLTIAYADGSSREFYQVGLSANTGGISVYLMGLDDKTYLARTYGDTLGKASISGYCIKFSTLRNIDLEVLEAAVRDGIAQTSAPPEQSLSRKP
jgi:hypothetical protein